MSKKNQSNSLMDLLYRRSIAPEQAPMEIEVHFFYSCTQIFYKKHKKKPSTSKIITPQREHSAQKETKHSPLITPQRIQAELD